MSRRFHVGGYIMRGAATHMGFAANVQATLMTLTADVQVSACQGNVVVRAVKELTRVEAATRSLLELAETVPGVEKVSIVPGLLANNAPPVAHRI